MRARWAMTPGILLAVWCLNGSAQVVNSPDFRALPRPIHFEMSLTPTNAPRAVIVYGKEAPWTQKAAEAVQKAVQAWSGVKLDLADDRTVTSDDTWLLADAYRRIPLIVLGNARDNRVMHALGVNYLLISNRSWPGGDRYVIRSLFEPFVADVNMIVLEASTEAGLNAAAARFAELLPTFGAEAKATATIPPRLHAIGGVQDKWEPRGPSWTARPPEWAALGDRSVTELVAAFKDKPILAGTAAGNAGVTADIWSYMVGGCNSLAPVPISRELDLPNQKAIAAMTLLGCRAVGGRICGYYDHYGVLGSLTGIRAILSSAVLSPEEVVELESAIVLSHTVPDDYTYGNIGGEIGWSLGGRHSLAVLLAHLCALDYAANHCRMDDKTRREVERRYDAARRSTARYVRSYRDAGDPYSDCDGEDTLIQVSCLLQQGLMENVRNGNLRRSADLYIMSEDNLSTLWGTHGNYVGLAGFTSEPGRLYSAFYGGALVDEAAFYYDDPMYRWLAQNWTGCKWSRGGGFLWFAIDGNGEAVKPQVPATYDGVRALPFDERLYAVLKDPRFHCGSQWTIGEEDFRLPPEPYEKAADCVAFRDGFDAQQAFLFLATWEPMRISWCAQNNSIARFTDLGNLWLFTNVGHGSKTGWSRNLVSISNGKAYLPHAGCTVEALSNVGEVSAVMSREEGNAGTDWTRTIVHWRGHYFVVLDRVQAQADDAYASVCRWRTTQLAELREGAWLATAPDGATMRIQNTDPDFQTSEYWECDGAARPYVLQQYKQARLAKGQALTFQNLMYVSGAARPDTFEARRAGPQAVLVKGRTGPNGQDHLALIGTGSRVREQGFYTDGTLRDAPAGQLRVTDLTRLSVKDPDSDVTREILWSSRVVDLRADCRTGKAEIEIGPGQTAQLKTGETWNEGQPGGLTTIPIAPPGALSVALNGNGEQIPLDGFETDAAVYDVFDETLHLAGVKTLRARIDGGMREIFCAPEPVNVRVDCRTGKGEIEVRGDRPLNAKAGETWSTRNPGRQPAVFAAAGVLPPVGNQLEALWSRSKAPARAAGAETAGGTPVFQAKPADTTFARPLRRLTDVALTATPGWNHNDDWRYRWDNTDNLEITLTLPQSAQIDSVRIPGTVERAKPVVGRNATQGEAWGAMGKYYKEGDFKFSLVLSDDGFQKDIRTIDSPPVTFEEIIEYGFQHYRMDRLPAWRIAVGQKARQIKLLPRATTKERPQLIMRDDAEVYEARRVDELTAKAIVADINGDGANELVVGTSEKDLAAFDGDGKRLWHKTCPGEIIKLDAADLDDTGKHRTLVLLGTERLLRIDADGAERPGGDLYEAQREAYHGCAGAAVVTSLGVWGPDDPRKKEVLLYSASPFRVLADGTMKLVPRSMGNPQASARLVNMVPGEREVLATIDSLGTTLWSPHRDPDGSYVKLGSVSVHGADGFERGAFALAQPINAPPFKGCVTAILSGINYFPITAFLPGAKDKGWSFDTAGVPAVAALVGDLSGAGVPQVFLARQDGFINALKLADGSSLGLLNAGEPILGMALLRGRHGKPCLAIGTKFSVQLFGADLKPIGKYVNPVPAAAFAGPGGKKRDRVFVVGADGQVTVLVLK